MESGKQEKRLGRWVPLVSNGWDGLGTDGREVGFTVAIFVNLTDEDAEKKQRGGYDQSRNRTLKRKTEMITMVMVDYSKYHMRGEIRTSCHL